MKDTETVRGAKDVAGSVHHSAEDQARHTDRSVRTGGRGVSVPFDVDVWKLGLVVADCLFIPMFFRSGDCQMLEVGRAAHPHRCHCDGMWRLCKESVPTSLRSRAGEGINPNSMKFIRQWQWLGTRIKTIF